MAQQSTSIPVEFLFRLEADLGSREQAAALLDYWIDATERMVALEGDARYATHRVLYERLVAEPEATLRRLFGFLGLGWEEDLLERIFATSHDRGAGDSKAAFARTVYRESAERGDEVLARLSIDGDRRRKVAGLQATLGYLETSSQDPGPPPTSEHAQVTSQPPPTESVHEIFEQYVPWRLSQRASSVRSFRGAALFHVEGTRGGSWRLSLDQALPQVSRYEPSASDRAADCTIHVLDSDLLALVRGEVVGPDLIGRGRLRIEGNRELADLVGWLLLPT